MGRRATWWTVGAATLALVLLAALTLDGPTRFLDSASYAAAVDAISNGRGLSVGLVPSFSDFTAVEFLRRGANIPFVDFPVGHPLVASPIALVVGAPTALLVLCLGCSAASAALIVRGPSGRRASHPTHAIRLLVALGLLLLPIHLDVIGAGLSESLFLVLLLAAAVNATSDDPRRWRIAVVLAGLAGAVRFVGLPVVAVPALLLYRREGARRTAPWVAIAVLPTVVDAAWAAAVGGGHRPGWRGLADDDLRFTLHSIAGWVWQGRGDFTKLFGNTSWPPLWSVPVALAWLVAGAWAVGRLLRGPEQGDRSLTVPLSMALVLTLSLFVGMAFFDALVVPDNRLMLPAGVLTIVGLLWWAGERFDARPVLTVTLAWIVAAVAPWSVRPLQAVPSSSDLVAAVGDARVVVSDDADAVWWETGAAAAYLPLPTRTLTGERVDQVAEFLPIPCLLAERQGVIVVTGGAFGDRSLQPELDRLTEEGVLDRTEFGAVVRYAPTAVGCADG